MSLYSSAIGTSATKDALSIIARVTLPFSSAMAQSTPGRRVEVSPSREQTARKALRSSMENSLKVLVDAHYKRAERRINSHPYQQGMERRGKRAKILIEVVIEPALAAAL